MTSVQVLGFCGLVSSFLVILGAAFGSFWPIAIGAFVMMCGNLYALAPEEN